MNETAHRPVLVVDFGAQYAQLIARRVREASVYSEIVPHTMPVARMLEKDPAAIILSGGPSSVYEDGAPHLDDEAALLTSGVPTMGICYGFQVMAKALGGTVAKTGLREYGRTQAHVSDAGAALSGSPQTQEVWMSHGDSVHEAPAGFTVLATTEGAPVAAFENLEAQLCGVQWHPEVKHSPLGQAAIENFLYRVAGLTPDWTSENVIDEQVARIREQVGDKRVICALSGGVDSAVAAAIEDYGIEVFEEGLALLLIERLTVPAPRISPSYCKILAKLALLETKCKSDSFVIECLIFSSIFPDKSPP